MESNHKMYRAVTYGNFQLDLPEFNWGVSVSVDTFNFEDKLPYRVFWQTEPNEIIPNQEKIIRNHGFYDLILAWDQEILSQCANAKLFPPGAVWVAEPDASQKQFQVSYLTSSKNVCPGHQYRQDIFNVLAEVKLVQSQHWVSIADRGSLHVAAPITLHRSPPYLSTKHSMLLPFQYTVVMENVRHNNNFTEKLNDALATKTIPIYWGAPNIGDFYNKEGIFAFNSASDLMTILRGLTPEFYASKQAVIEENYQKALTYADRTGNIARAIIDSWTPKISTVHSGAPNAPPV